jgi:hypothetical protein
MGQLADQPIYLGRNAFVVGILRAQSNELPTNFDEIQWRREVDVFHADQVSRKCSCVQKPITARATNAIANSGTPTPIAAIAYSKAFKANFTMLLLLREMRGLVRMIVAASTT